MDNGNFRGRSPGISGFHGPFMRYVYILFFFSVAIFGILQLVLFLAMNLPNWVVFYVNDFLVMPIVLTICLFVVHRVSKDRRIRLSLFTIFSLASLYAIYFELYLPQHNPRYTADILDVVMYFSGGLLFYFSQDKRPHWAAIQ